MTEFQTNESVDSCLNCSILNVFTTFEGQPVAVATASVDCFAQDFVSP